MFLKINRTYNEEMEGKYEKTSDNLA